jgi:dCMP deaminase
LITAGVKRVVVFSDYHDTMAMEFFAKAQVAIDRITMPEKSIHYDLKSYTSAK